MNAALVKIDVAAARLGWSADKLFDLVDGGTLLEKGFAWVWNLANALDGERRDLRFWWPEIEARAQARNQTKFSYYELPWVIAKILPPRRVNFHAGEIDQMFQIRPRTRIDLHAELAGRLEGGRNFYSRAALARFLERRWLGSVSSRISPPIHRPAADSRGDAAVAGLKSPLIAKSPTCSPARGRGNVRTAQFSAMEETPTHLNRRNKTHADERSIAAPL